MLHCLWFSLLGQALALLHSVGMRDFDAAGFTELELAFFKRGELLEQAASIEAWEALELSEPQAAEDDDLEWEWEIALARARHAA